MPALQHARSIAKRTMCKNNLRTQHRGFFMFQLQNHMYSIPLHLEMHPGDGGADAPEVWSWHDFLMTKLDPAFDAHVTDMGYPGFANLTDPTSNPNLKPNQGNYPSGLPSATSSMEDFHTDSPLDCPEASNSPSSTFPHFTVGGYQDYAVINWGMPNYYPWDPKDLTPAPFGDSFTGNRARVADRISNPERRILFIDQGGTEMGGTGGGPVGPVPGGSTTAVHNPVAADIYNHGTTDRHQGGANAVHLDGSHRYIRNMYKDKTADSNPMKFFGYGSGLNGNGGAPWAWQ
jgi:prepilin-type processing-associated H-X9-DG protein